MGGIGEETEGYKERAARREKEQQEANQSLGDWGFLWPTEIEEGGASMFGLGAALFGGARVGKIFQVVCCEDCGTMVGVPSVEDPESFDRLKAPVNLHARHCVAITAAARKARFDERVAARERTDADS